jgi:hypothetical protein
MPFSYESDANKVLEGFVIRGKLRLDYRDVPTCDQSNYSLY